MTTQKQIEQVLEELVRPAIRQHGGDVRLVDYRNGLVTVELLGACAGCPNADLSTRGFIEDTLRSMLPDITEVELFQAVDPELLAFARKLLSKE